MAILTPIYHVDLCSGSGMLGVGLDLALGGIRTVAYVERESYSAATLVARMEDAALDFAPVWDDIATIDCDEFCEHVAGFRPLIVSGGYPCQPFSCAGKRAGVEDERHLWPHIARFVERSQPDACFFENVSGHVSLGFREVVADLRRLGYRVEAGMFTASEVGASHQRKRLFVLAELAHTERSRNSRGTRKHSRKNANVPQFSSDAMADAAIQREREPEHTGGTVARVDTRQSIGGGSGAMADPGVGQFPDARRGSGGRSGVDGAGASLAIPAHRGLGVLREPSGSNGQPDGRDEELADADGGNGNAIGAGRNSSASSGNQLANAERQGHEGPEPAGRARADGCASEYGLSLFAPGPGARDEWAAILERYPEVAPAVERELRRTTDGLASGMEPDRLRLTGNGVCPLQAAFAFVTLWASLYGGGLMSDKPILFSGPMICSILNGSKTQTRRVRTNLEVGDIAWVKETWAQNIPGCPNGITYLADHVDPRGDGPAHPIKWKPPKCMPRRASRISLEITGRREEFLQYISEADAVAEGCCSQLFVDMLRPLAEKARPQLPYWGIYDGSILCKKCAVKRHGKNIDGGWIREEDGIGACEDCGALLDYTLTDYGVTEELEEYESRPGSCLDPRDAFAIHRMLGADGNPLLGESCGDFDYKPELKGRIARLCYRTLWDSLKPKPGFRWADNPRVQVLEFRRVWG